MIGSTFPSKVHLLVTPQRKLTLICLKKAKRTMMGVGISLWIKGRVLMKEV